MSEAKLEQYSIECRKAITLANHKDTNNPVNQSKLKVIILADAKRGKTSASELQLV